MRYKLRRTSVLLLALAASFACVPRLGGAPTIQVSPADVSAGSVIRVTGTGWKAGERVVIGLKTPDQPVQQSQPVADSLANATGGFVAVFAFPKDSAWTPYSALSLVAHSTDWARTAQATVHRAVSATSTPVPLPTRTVAPPTPSQVRALGYVDNVANGSRIIKLRLVEGNTEAIAVTDQTRFAADGGTAQFSDVRIGDLIEATGQRDANGRLLATQVRILVQSTEVAPPSPTPAPVAPNWRGEYFDNTTLSGQPRLVRDDPVIDFQWRSGAPAPGLPADTFAVRWTGTWSFDAGVYRFFAQVDDGVRLWIGRQLVIDQWHESTGALYNTDAYLSAGPQTVRVEYFEARSNALARVWWEYGGEDPVPVIMECKGAYFPGMSLAGNPLFVVSERVIDFNWGSGSPFRGVPSDEFSARWTCPVDLSSGLYRFYAAADDGVRVIVDSTKVIDRWRDGSQETLSGDIGLAGGSHVITVEYFEHAGQAMIHVWWELLPSTPTPTMAPSPTTSPTTAPTATLAPTSTATATMPVRTRTPVPRLPTALPAELITPTVEKMSTTTPRPSANALFETFLPQIGRDFGPVFARAPGTLQSHQDARPSPSGIGRIGGYAQD